MPARLKDERGQAAIFMALFASTMILLFAFTTNVGMLVHAKINLQNAADAAAYAGAAAQARQLTAVSYLNWEMRRALKEFLFYYTVRGQMNAMPCFPLSHTGQRIGMCPQIPGQQRHDFSFMDPREGGLQGTNECSDAAIASGNCGPFIPSTCIIFDPNNNYCQKAGVPGIPQFPAGGSWGVADPIVAAVRNATNQIIDKKLEDCASRTDVNRKFLSAWLFAFNPYREVDPFFGTGADVDDPFPFGNGLERLGVLPRMAMLRARIDNLEEALNLNLALEGVGSPTITDQTMGMIRSLAGGIKPLDYFERPIQAYLSAKNNLPTIGDENGNFAEIELTELLPSQGGSVDTNPYLRNPPILAKFENIYGRVTLANSKFESLDSGFDKGNCFQFRESRVIPRFPFGVTKNPEVLTYYAVRLQTKARLLFSPFGGNGIVTLQAYSAAKPFGSRVGKHLNPAGNDPVSDGVLEMMMGRALPGRSFQGGGIVGDITDYLFTKSFIPNLLVEAQNPAATSEVEGFTTNSHLGYLRAAVAMTGRLDYGPRLAGAYAPWEVGFYNPPANYHGDVIGKFEDNPIYNGKYFSLLAPIFPVNGSTNNLYFIKERVSDYFYVDEADKETLAGKFLEFMNTIMDDAKVVAMTDYIRQSRETLFHYIPDPLLSDEPALLQYTKSIPGNRWTVAGMADSHKRQLTSWNNQKTAGDSGDASMGIEGNSELGPDMGRSGYSVRFISFSTLRAGGQGTNDPQQADVQWSSPIDRMELGEAATRIFDDINKLKH